MKTDNTKPRDQSPAPSAEPDPPFGSNAVRLGTGQWVAVTLISVVILSALPRLWAVLEPLNDDPDYRAAYSQSEDYWQYGRYVARAKSQQKIAVIGDSVIWGEYVTPQQTLTNYLNEQAASPRFVNLGLNGAHPLALEGLVSCYATALHDEPVLLHCNLLWMSSPERDLQVDKELPFNHPRLVPQFVPSIPCYKAPLDERMGTVVDRNLAVRGWALHLRFAFFDGQDIPSWTLEHPHDNPLAQIRFDATPLDDELRHSAAPWFEQGIEPQDIPWIELESSLQWQAFRRTVEDLAARGNRVFVMIGPLNEHMLTTASRARLHRLREGVESWLRERDISHMSPPLLPSDEYADASHPLSAGYQRLAQALREQAEFQNWLQTR